MQSWLEHRDAWQFVLSPQMKDQTRRRSQPKKSENWTVLFWCLPETRVRRFPWWQSCTEEAPCADDPKSARRCWWKIAGPQWRGQQSWLPRVCLRNELSMVCIGQQNITRASGVFGTIFFFGFEDSGNILAFRGSWIIRWNPQDRRWTI